MPNNFKGYCPSCRLNGLKAPRVCALTGLEVGPEDYCSKHRRSLVTCSICGQIILTGGILNDNHLICNNCFSNLNSCNVCRFNNICTFETDPSPLPKAIQKEIRRGNMQAVTQVMNPERVQITCEKGCKCFSKENGCLKQKGSCTNVDVLYND